MGGADDMAWSGVSRWRVGVLVSALVVGSLTGCGAGSSPEPWTAPSREPDPPPTTEPTPTREPTRDPTPARTPPPGVRISAQVTQLGDSRLAIDYQVANGGDEPIVVFDGVPARDSPNPAEPVAEAFYAIGTGSFGARLTKQVFPTPPGVAVHARHVLHGTVVPPGRSVEAHAETDVPTTTRYPYQGVGGQPPVPATIHEVELCLGVARAADVHPLPTGSDPAHPVYAHDEFTFRHQYVWCSGPYGVSVGE
jgi:hypothetical protein